jgi:hypothetical protein
VEQGDGFGSRDRLTRRFGAALDRDDDLADDVLVNVEAFCLHGVPFISRAAGLRPRGGRGTGHMGRAIKRCAARRAANRGGAAQSRRLRMGAALIVWRGGPVNVPHMGRRMWAA